MALFDLISPLADLWYAVISLVYVQVSFGIASFDMSDALSVQNMLYQAHLYHDILLQTISDLEGKVRRSSGFQDCGRKESTPEL